VASFASSSTLSFFWERQRATHWPSKKISQRCYAIHPFPLSQKFPRCSCRCCSSIQKQLLPLTMLFTAFCVFGYRHHTKSDKVGYCEVQLRCYVSGEVKRATQWSLLGRPALAVNALFIVAWHRPLECDLSRL
jgi:hypothetical protein